MSQIAIFSLLRWATVKVKKAKGTNFRNTECTLEMYYGIGRAWVVAYPVCNKSKVYYVHSLLIPSVWHYWFTQRSDAQPR